MQPKPVDFRRLLDIDAQRRIVDTAGFAEHLRGLREHKEHPAETDYDAVHDEQGRRDREEASGRPAEEPEGALPEKEKGDPKETPQDPKRPPDGQKGIRLDIEA